jgi:hypothetical protein
MITITNTETYQLFYLKNAINELLSIYPDEKRKEFENKLIIKEDHLNGCNYINNIKIPITFPLYIRNYISNLSKQKIFNYFYKGTITGTKLWVLPYKNQNNSIIEESKRGRTKLKYEIDENYYKEMSSAKFTLCPTEWGNHETSWTYRFFEAIMCLSIPILENNSNDQFKHNYFFYFNTDNHVYDEQKAIDNYNKFINSHHFLNNLKLLL